MFAYLNDIKDVSSLDVVWETDFGMPSAHMILVVSLYYAYKVLFYC